jgi:HlyD family secretion protein
MKKRRFIIAGIIVLTVVAAGVYGLFRTARDHAPLVLSGVVEVTETRIGFKIPGRVLSLLSDEGRTVAKGDKIAVLDSAEYESLFMQYKAGVSNAEAQMEKAKKDFERYGPLYKSGVITAQQMESAKTAFDVARAQLELSRAALRTADVRLKDTAIHASLAGTVIGKHVEEGETVSAGVPVFTIGDLEHPWIKVYVKENRLGLVSLGQKVDVTTDSYPGKTYEGTIVFISSEAEFTPKNVQTQEERVKLVFGIKVKVENVNNELKPGMPADVKIPLK